MEIRLLAFTEGASRAFTILMFMCSPLPFTTRRITRKVCKEIHYWIFFIELTGELLWKIGQPYLIIFPGWSMFSQHSSPVSAISTISIINIMIIMSIILTIILHHHPHHESSPSVSTWCFHYVFNYLICSLCFHYVFIMFSLYFFIILFFIICSWCVHYISNIISPWSGLSDGFLRAGIGPSRTVEVM